MIFYHTTLFFEIEVKGIRNSLKRKLFIFTKIDIAPYQTGKYM